ncbi:1,4-dihydroxy-2-naphthoate octaprenyltransferase [Mesohalobacter halotolerans]|uniref:1,4-dihydroxy-2-naphthoate octaprenyltransferase n=1 Tax=Mesohalobacter halotolerans TaxID=1883405 RepID=UPI001486D631|nr:1,4-dihydroxy-2-naphthoate octaprenyltransferase [Mesohalobacter halotolerans]MBS3739432.1 1,4-dihydroxy-2-naphthoate octaprenyltransferase [Psychroflexus sp.]
MADSKISAWIDAARLRTLPLSVSGILVGSGYAVYHDCFDSLIFFLAILTTLLFQILSNFANDYGDGVKGTDNDERLGPQRAYQSGKITKPEFKTGLIITSMLSFFSAAGLILVAFGFDNALMSFTFFILGLIAIWAAIKYTVGDSAYGYRGFGDVFVFLFFGLVSVCGSYVLHAKTIDWQIYLGGAGIGLLSAAVLNLNNMRDINSDKNAGKNTLVVALGQLKAKYYHTLLIGFGILSLIGFYTVAGFSKWIYLSMITMFLLIKHLIFVQKNENPKQLDQELKKVALSTFGIALLFFVIQFFVK